MVCSFTKKVRTDMSFINRFFNSKKSKFEIEQEITQRRTQGRPTKQLEDELHARGPDLALSIDGALVTDHPDNQLPEERKAQIEKAGGWTGPINREMNRAKSTNDIRSEIAERQAQGKPTRQLQDELNSRGHES